MGVIFNRAALKAAEVDLAKRYGLNCFESREEEASFGLPCKLYKDGRCSVYAGRLEACKRYRCQLLQRLTAGEISLEESKAAVLKIKSLMNSINKRLVLESSGNFKQRIVTSSPP